jgi:mono/diheme cytochrome c family protein
MQKPFALSFPATWCGLLAASAAVVACGGGGSVTSPFLVGPPTAVDAGIAGGLQPVYDPVVTQPVAPPPISGGTLAVSSDGSYAFAADPDRDAFYVVDLQTRSSATVALNPGDEPGRVVEDSAGRVHVVLRRAGAVASIDPATKTVLGRASVCPRPRGIAYMASSDSLYVACAGGELVTVPAAGGEPTRTVVVEPDLRDVIVVGTSLYVSELRSATILQIASDGSIANRFARPISDLEPGVAWRMIPTPSGLAVSLQAASSAPISPEPGSYGTGGCGGAVTNPQIGTWSLDGSSQGLSTLQGVLPVDIALSPDGTTFAVVVPGEWLIPGSPQLVIMPSAVAPDDAGPSEGLGGPAPPSLGCGSASSVSGQATAVAYDLAGRVLVQTREPAQLVLDASGLSPALISLSTISRDDTGHEIFHSDQGGSIACASCHIEGGDDGRTWVFTDVGQRRTPSVLGTVEGTAPYHWDGSQLNLPMLYSGSLARMNGADLVPDQQNAFTAWLDALPGPAPVAGDAASIARGEALFQGSGGCETCHSGARFTNNQTLDVGTGAAFQVPPLVGVSARPPFLHDGCAPTLIDAIGACGHASTHGGTASFTSAQLADLAAYLGSL